MPKASSRSAGATYLNKRQRLAQLRAAARRGAERVPSVRRVLLFGSFVSGTPTPRSDADLLVIVERSAEERARDRIPAMLQALRPLPCPVDLFVLTRQEFEQMRQAGASLVRTALQTGQDLLPAGSAPDD